MFKRKMPRNDTIQYAPFSIENWQKIEREGGTVISAGCLWIVYLMRRK